MFHDLIMRPGYNITSLNHAYIIVVIENSYITLLSLAVSDAIHWATPVTDGVI